MFDFLKGGKAHITVTLDRTTPYLPGERVRAQIMIETQGEFKVQEGRVALIYQEEYQYREERTSHDSDGDTRREITATWTTSDIEVQREVFAREGTFPKNSQQVHEFAALIPANALPTLGGGKILRSRWLVKATLDRRLAADVNAEAPLTVVTLAPVATTPPGEFGTSNEPADAEMALALPGREFVAGDTVSGQLIVRPAKHFDASEVRVELVRVEHVPRDKGNTHEEAQRVKVAGGTKFLAGQPQTFPFTLAVPSNAPPSATTPNGTITWTVKGVLARTLRSDTRVEEAVVVFPARAARG